MLYNLVGRVKENLPHEEDFRWRRENVPDEDYYALFDRVSEYCGAHDTVKAAYFAGSDWMQGFWRVLEEACGGDREEAGMFLGQILWVVLQERDDDWYFYREESIGDNVQGMTYFRRND